MCIFHVYASKSTHNHKRLPISTNLALHLVECYKCMQSAAARAVKTVSQMNHKSFYKTFRRYEKVHFGGARSLRKKRKRI